MSDTIVGLGLAYLKIRNSVRATNVAVGADGMPATPGRHPRTTWTDGQLILKSRTGGSQRGWIRHRAVDFPEPAILFH
jgi:hypothetical protein